MGMFQTKQEVEHYFSGDILTCLICGEKKKSLGTHLFRKHKGISVDDYKIKFGLPHSRGLVSNATARVQAESLKRRIALGDKSIIIDPTKLDRKISRPKHRPVYYSRKAHIPFTEVVNKKSHEKSLEKINSIDWDCALETMRSLKIAAHSLSKIKGMPSQDYFQKKRKMDAEFNEKYLNVVTFLKNIKKTKKIEKICPICGRSFLAKPNQKRRNCSKKCMAKDFSLRGLSFGGNRWRKHKKDAGDLANVNA